MKTIRIFKRGLGVLLAVILLLGTACGRSQEEKVGTGANESGAQKGGYVENEIELPEGLQGKQIFQMDSRDGKLRLIVSEPKSDTEAGSLQEWEYDGQAFAEVTPGWLKQIDLPISRYMTVKVMRDPQNPEINYLFSAYQDNVQEDFRGHLWKASGDEVVEITPEAWTKLNENGYYEYPGEMALVDGLLAGDMYDRIVFYQPDDGRLAHETVLTGRYMGGIAAREDQYYLLAAGETGNLSGLDVFVGQTDLPRETIPYEAENANVYGGFNFMDVADNGTLLLGNAEGFWGLKPGESTWERLLEGMDSSMARLDIWCQGVAAMDDGSFYARYTNDNNDSILMHYVYDPEAVVEITEILTVYTVGQSFLLQQAAVLFHNQYPNVRIEVEVAVAQEEEWSGNVDYQELSRTLNTRLMAGEGADILVMDRLNQEPYIEKGLLVDLNDFVAPLEEKGELMENITGTYLQADGKRYMVPLGFALVLGVGREIAAAQMEDLSSLAEMMALEEESLLGPLTPGELLDMFLPYFSGELLNGQELDREALKKNLEYLKIIGENSGIIAGRGTQERAFNIWDIPSKARLALQEDAGFNDAMIPIAVAQLVNGDYAAFGNAFYPKLEIGINAQSEHIDTAKEFIAFALSQSVQDQDYYQSYPINRRSLSVQSQADRSMAEVGTTIEVGDGVMQEFIIKQYDAQEADKLLAICGRVNRKAGVDAVVREKIANALPAYLDGSSKVDETVAAIEGELRMYLQE